MSANRDTYISAVKSADDTKKATVASAVTASITTVNASGVDTGYRLGFPSGNAAYVAGVAAANATLIASRAAAEATRIAAISAAKDTLRSQGEIP